MKNFLSPVKRLTSQSLAAGFSSTPTDIRYLDNVSIQLNTTTANAVGTFSVEGSLDYQKGQDDASAAANSGTWVTIVSAPPLAGANVNTLLDLNQLSFPYVRVTYTRTSGTGTVDMYISAKEV